MGPIGDVSQTAPSSLNVSGVPADQVALLWPRIEPLVEKALRHGEGDESDPATVRAELEAGRMVLWVIHDAEIVAVLVLKVLVHPRKKTLHLVLTAGTRLAEWVGEIEGLLRDYAGLIGADTIEASCRDGLMRVLKKRDWKRKATIMELPI